MVVVVRYRDADWHRLDGEGCPDARSVLHRQTYEREDIPEGELGEFLDASPGRPCPDCAWPS